MIILEEVYVAVVEAVKSYIPAGAERKAGDLFLITQINQFDPGDNSSFFQFLPGDTVRCSTQNGEDALGNENQVLVADSLMGSIHPDRDLFMLKFLIVDNEGELTNEQMVYFQPHIERLIKDVILQRESTENPFHPAILRWFDWDRR